ncbi:MAG: hypothetical protein NTV91_08825 [Proteobacteria bacterium]|jgi:uncharacterized membrane protein|nr:hypothetical protein [Pseudomonadota bacterium]
MKKTAQFIKDTLVGGVLFLLPGALLLWLAEKVLPLARQLMKPVENLLPGHLVAQFALGTLLAVLALLLVAFIAGLLARTAPGQRLIRWIEESIVGSLPQYRMAKSVLEGRGGGDGDGVPDVQPVLVPAGEGWRIGMKFDSIEGGWASVFLPNSPKARTGSIVLLPESSLRPLDLPIGETTLLLSRLGGGAGAALRGVKLD